MNKTDLIRQMARKSELPQKTCRLALDQLMAIITEQMYHSDVVTLPQLGSFKVGFNAPRIYTHPQTGEKLERPASRQVVFSPARHLKAAVQPNDLVTK